MNNIVVDILYSHYGDYAVDVRKDGGAYEICIQKNGVTHAMSLGRKFDLDDALEFAEKIVDSSHIEAIYKYAGG